MGLGADSLLGREPGSACELRRVCTDIDELCNFCSLGRWLWVGGDAIASAYAMLVNRVAAPLGCILRARVPLLPPSLLISVSTA